MQSFAKPKECVIDPREDVLFDLNSVEDFLIDDVRRKPANMYFLFSDDLGPYHTKDDLELPIVDILETYANLIKKRSLDDEQRVLKTIELRQRYVHERRIRDEIREAEYERFNQLVESYKKGAKDNDMIDPKQYAVILDQIKSQRITFQQFRESLQEALKRVNVRKISIKKFKEDVKLKLKEHNLDFIKVEHLDIEGLIKKALVKGNNRKKKSVQREIFSRRKGKKPDVRGKANFVPFGTSE